MPPARTLARDDQVGGPAAVRPDRLSRGQHLLGPCRPLDIADMAVYLGSDEARVVTGQVISVDSRVTIS